MFERTLSLELPTYVHGGRLASYVVTEYNTLLEVCGNEGIVCVSVANEDLFDLFCVEGAFEEFLECHSE